MKLIIGNWKMHGNRHFAEGFSAEFFLKLCKNTTKNTVVICPPYPFLYASFAPLKKGAQNCFLKEHGPYTGEISAEILKDMGCEYVILGHSERRYLGESSQDIAAKAACAHKAGLIAIICVGENKGEDKFTILNEQIKHSLPFTADSQNTVIAYEPVWAIGTGKTPEIPEIEDAHSYIKSLKNFNVLYGGSVKSHNAAEISRAKNVDGLLVGGASLNIEEFSGIVADIENYEK